MDNVQNQTQGEKMTLRNEYKKYPMCNKLGDFWGQLLSLGFI